MRRLQAYFEAQPNPKGYADELAAIADGSKALSWFSTSGDDYGFLDSIRSRADEIGLTTISFDEQDNIDDNVVTTTRLYVCKDENRWRVNEHRAFLRIREQGWLWSLEGEACESLLLGYDHDMICELIRFRRMTQISSGCCAVYIVSALPYLEKSAAYGFRCLSPYLGSSVVRVVIPRVPSVLKASAADLLPSEIAIARVAVRWPTITELFPDFPRPRSKTPFIRRLRETEIPKLNGGIRSEIQIVDAGSAKATAPSCPTAELL